MNNPVQRVITIHPTPKEMADTFASHDCINQASFFNHLAAAIKENWRDGIADFQFAAISAEEHLTDSARALMKLIGEYAEKP